MPRWWDSNVDDNARKLGSVLEGLFGAGGSVKMNAHKRALATWMRVNGDVERKHTCGAFIRPHPHADPILIIYLDSRTRVVDFNANRELYLQRLAYGGLPLSRIEFKLAKELPVRELQEDEEGEEQLIELTEEEMEYVRSCTGHLGEPLKTSVSKAMIMSLRREKTFPS